MRKKTILAGNGNISAHAEKTVIRAKNAALPRKHLCACREDKLTTNDLMKVLETSLRMQRRLLMSKQLVNVSRNISAHAEKTPFPPDKHLGPRKHLCACREDEIFTDPVRVRSETSLRMQRRPFFGFNPVSWKRNISAHAEKTLYKKILSLFFRKHLCACREDHRSPSTTSVVLETSLRMQRRP